MISPQENRNFIENLVEEIIDTDLLEKAIDWIKVNLQPDEVFDKDELVEWASLSETPEGVFGEEPLHEWARENGYTKKEE